MRSRSAFVSALDNSSPQSSPSQLHSVCPPNDFLFAEATTTTRLCAFGQLQPAAACQPATKPPRFTTDKHSPRPVAKAHDVIVLQGTALMVLVGTYFRIELPCRAMPLSNRASR